MEIVKEKSRETRGKLGNSSRQNRPPRNPNKRPTNINMERSIGRMKAKDRSVIERAF
ncbi:MULTISPECIES: hypothetical protein [Bacillus]|uniref:hypothetical protein n=1 Tax=Bacillus TaxID=1386 RepID=UPI000A3E5F08|nr:MULTISPECIES: hypothetical protein [Bacillus]MBC9025716.1 hypothetical protein [Bacillus subtilis]MCH4862842.1 hypothetical protein [Bacillus sp. 1006-3]MCJ2152720.1 hypothetical protein [Bacillus subtilis]MCM3188899.1 hypothetical protein [Bacillus subtilis]MCR4381190.1 hypothetical protein [Bacillus subtilis]